MLTSDCDRYYTPSSVANVVACAIDGVRPRTVLDSACGSGSLLSAAEAAYPKVRCIGIDNDRRVIKQLRLERPKWTLLVGDALERETWLHEQEGKIATRADVAVLNPPFSMGPKKGEVFRLWNREVRCSLAMAHILVALEHSKAKLAIAIVPESWAYSDLDSGARRLLSERYGIEVVTTLKNSTFSGARANALLVRLERSSALSRPALETIRSRSGLSVESIDIVRGGLPVFEAVRIRGGFHFIHSTDICAITSDKNIDKLPRVHNINRGLVSGHVILVPRVGSLRQEYLRAVNLSSPCQLSDCVIAFCLTDSNCAARLKEFLVDRFDEFRSLYHGTGARYVTVSRLREWLATYCAAGVAVNRVAEGVLTNQSSPN